MDWAALAPVALGAISALAGAGLAELGQWGRSRRNERSNLAARIEDRRAELWEISLPAAARVRDLFASAVRVSAPPSPWRQEEPGYDFDDQFPEWWEDKFQELTSQVALIPAPDFRSALNTLADGVSYGWGLARKSGYASSSSDAINQIGQIGFDVASAWMRDEHLIDTELRDRVNGVERAVAEMHDQYQIEFEHQADPNEPGTSQ